MRWDRAGRRQRGAGRAEVSVGAHMGMGWPGCIVAVHLVGMHKMCIIARRAKAWRA